MDRPWKSAQRTEPDSNTTVDVWLGSCVRKHERSECFSTRAMCRNPFFPSVVLQNTGIEVIFVLTRAHSLSRQQFDSATDSCCSEWRYAQELEIPIGLQAVSDVDELMPSRPVTLRDPVSPNQTVVEYHKLTYFPSQPWFKRYPVDDTLHVVNSRKLMQWCLNFSLIFRYIGDGGALQIACFLFGTDASSGAIFVFLTPG